jgi:hypothetical protein
MSKRTRPWTKRQRKAIRLRTQPQIIPQLPAAAGVHLDVVDGELVMAPGPADTNRPVVYEPTEGLPPLELDWA